MFVLSTFECMAGSVDISTPWMEIPRNRSLTLCREAYLDYPGTSCYVLILVKIMAWEKYSVLPSSGGRRPELGDTEDLYDNSTVMSFGSF